METLSELITLKDVIQIRELYRDGLCRQEVVEYTGIDRDLVFGIIDERLYKNEAIPPPIVEHDSVSFHPRSSKHGYHKPTKEIWSYAQHHRYGRKIAEKLTHIKMKANDGSTISRRREVFVRECLAKIFTMIGVKKKKNSLIRNKKAMSLLRRLVKEGKSNQYISDRLYEDCGHRWSPRTVSRIRNLPKMKKRNFEQEAAKFAFSNEESPIDVLQDYPVENTFGVPKTKTTIKEYFDNIDPTKLSFGDLCSYTASFFEELEGRDKDDAAKNGTWRLPRDKVFAWNKTRERTKVDLSRFTHAQTSAYDYCMSMYTKTITGNSQYGEVYSLYREWRRAFIKQLSKLVK